MSHRPGPHCRDQDIFVGHEGSGNEYHGTMGALVLRHGIVLRMGGDASAAPPSAARESPVPEGQAHKSTFKKRRSS